MFCRGQPCFKTVRALGGRALVADTFSKGENCNGLGRHQDTANGTLDESALIPGMGIAAHRTAYNVLYGDWHVKLLGDPEERIVWHKQGYGTTGRAQLPGILGAQYFYNATFLTALGDAEDTNFAYTALRVWHDMDVEAGMDVPTGP